MVSKKLINYRNKQRKNFRKKPFIPRSLRLSKMAVGAPQSIIRKLRYQQADSLLPGASGVVDANVFRLNSLYDPDETGAGGQPRFFDQYMTMYDKYVVLGARVKVQFIGVNTTEQMRVGICVQDSGTAQTTGEDYIENERLQKNTLLGIEGSGTNNKTLILNWSAKKWFAHPSITSERDMEGTSSSNPTTVCRLYVYADQPWGITVSTGVRYMITIDYIVKFREPNAVAAS